MTADGLSLEHVQQRWQESQALLDELRARLEVLATASSSAAEAASNAQSGGESLARIAEAQQGMLAAFAELQGQAISAVDSLRVASTNNDTGRLMHEVAAVADAVGRLSQSVAATDKTLAGIATGITKLTESLAKQGTQVAALTAEVTAVKKLVQEAGETATRIREIEIERDTARENLQTAIAAVPGRFASKIQSAIGQQPS